MNQDLSYISCPLPEDIERLVYFGDLERAQKVIRARMASEKTPQVLKQRLAFELEIIKDLPLTFNHSEEEMFGILSSSIRDFTMEEMQALRDDETLDWIYLNGKPYYKNNCYDSLIKTRLDYQPRVIDQTPILASRAKKAELGEVIRRMKEKGHLRLRFKMRTEMTVNPEFQRPGERIRVWMTLPLKSGQCVPGEISTSPAAKHIAAEDHPQRTAYFEETYEPGMVFAGETVHEIDAPYVDPKPEEVSAEQPHFDTEEFLPQIRFTPFIRALAAELKGDETNPLIIARRFYDYVTTNTCYRFVPPYFTKTCIPEYFGIGQRGDCGMHALLFITLCRCAGIPAQWQAGLAAEPDEAGCHDWARYYIAPYGWLYADGSYGGSAYRTGDLERWNFYFANLDPWRMVANTAIQQELDPPLEHYRADPYDNQCGEMAYDDRALTLKEFDTRWTILACDEIDD